MTLHRWASLEKWLSNHLFTDRAREPESAKRRKKTEKLAEEKSFREHTLAESLTEDN